MWEQARVVSVRRTEFPPEQRTLISIIFELFYFRFQYSDLTTVGVFAETVEHTFYGGRSHGKPSLEPFLCRQMYTEWSLHLQERENTGHPKLFRRYTGLGSPKENRS